MKTRYTLIALGLVALLGVSGVAAATGGPAGAAAQVQTDDRPLDGSNSPWATEDERVDLFQERFDLTDEQVAEIDSEVEALLEEDASREEIRDTVRELLEEYGVEDPTLGPPADRGPGSNSFDTDSDTRAGFGGAGGSGPHGPADGSCLA